MKPLRIFFLAAIIISTGIYSVNAATSLPALARGKPPTSTTRPTKTRAATPTRTPTRTFTSTFTSTNTFTPTNTHTPTQTPTETFTPTFTSTSTHTPTQTFTSTFTPTNTPQSSTPFTFVSMGDAQNQAAIFQNTTNQIASLSPAFVIFNGDLENNGFATAEMNQMVNGLKTSGIFNQTFLVRGNHDNNIAGSAALWETYFETAPNIRTFPAGVTEYVSLNSSSDNLTFSFMYGNSIFIGLDVPGNVSLISSAVLTFLDNRLTYAEGKGLVHAFISFHGPMYCVESVHCTCTTRTDAACTPSALVTVINKHPIVSAFLQGHELILGWTHMDNTRLASLTGSFEEFITSPSGGSTYNANLFPARMDYYYPTMLSSDHGFATISVDGTSFTYSIFKVGTSTPVWSRTFTK